MGILALALSWFLGLHLAPAVVAVPTPVSDMLAKHCTGCHDSSHFLDLSPSGPGISQELLLSVIEEVKSQRMPPPGASGDVKERFTLNPDERATLAESLSGLIAKKPRRVLPAHTTDNVWRDIAARLASATSPKKFQLRRPAPVRLSPAALFLREEASAAYCLKAGERLKIGALFAKATNVPTVETTTNEASRRLLEALFFRKFQSAELSQAARILRTLKEPTGSWSSAWVGLCSLYLSGPNLMYPFEPRSWLNER